MEHWGSPDMFKTMVAATRTLEDWELVAFAIIAAGARLRVGEAITAVPTLQRPGTLQFYGEKSRRGWQTSQLGPYPRAWAKVLAQLRQWQMRPSAVALHGSLADVEASMARLFSGTAFQVLRFHSCGRFGAATLFHAGCPIPVLMSWGGWFSRPVAMHYGQARPGWVFERRHLLPWPQVRDRSISWELSEVPYTSWFPDWVVQEVPPPAARTTAQPQGQDSRKRARTSSPRQADATGHR